MVLLHYVKQDDEIIYRKGKNLLGTMWIYSKVLNCKHFKVLEYELLHKITERLNKDTPEEQLPF